MLKNKNGGFLHIIVTIVVVLLLMRYFGITISGILAYFHLSIPEVVGWFKTTWQWFFYLFNSVK